MEPTSIMIETKRGKLSGKFRLLLPGKTKEYKEIVEKDAPKEGPWQVIGKDGIEMSDDPTYVLDVMCDWMWDGKMQAELIVHESLHWPLELEDLYMKVMGIMNDPSTYKEPIKVSSPDGEDYTTATLTDDDITIMELI
jgi:hypothetical protein